MWVGRSVAQPFRRSLWRRLRSAAVLSLVLLLQLHGFAQAPTGNWNQFRGNARLTGIAEVAPPASLSVKWTYDAGDAIDSSPAIADNVVYIGSAKGELLA